VEDVSGRFDWAAPDEEVHAFVNDLMRPIGTHVRSPHVRDDGLLGDRWSRRRRPRGQVRIRLIETRGFAGGVVNLRYAVDE